MKAKIIKSIGNCYLIMVEDNIYDVVTWKRASALLDCRPTIQEVNFLTDGGKEIKYNERPTLTEEKESKLKSKVINWIDGRRTLGQILSRGASDKRILITQYVFSQKLNGFKALENPKIEYSVKVQGVEILIHKDLFFDIAGSIEVVHKRGG
jgi:hypothetical protein